MILVPNLRRATYDSWCWNVRCLCPVVRCSLLERGAGVTHDTLQSGVWCVSGKAALSLISPKRVCLDYSWDLFLSEPPWLTPLRQLTPPPPPHPHPIPPSPNPIAYLLKAHWTELFWLTMVNPSPNSQHSSTQSPPPQPVIHPSIHPSPCVSWEKGLVVGGWRGNVRPVAGWKGTGKQMASYLRLVCEACHSNRLMQVVWLRERERKKKR